MKIFDFLKEHHFNYDEINTDNFTITSLPKNKVNFNDSDIKEVLKKCYFLDQDEFISQLVVFMNERLKKQNLSFKYENTDQNRLLSGSDGQCVDLESMIFYPYIQDGKIADQAYYCYLDNEIGQTWHNKTLTGVAETARKYQVYNRIEKNHDKIYKTLYENTIRHITETMKNGRIQSDFYINSLNVDMLEPFPRLLPEVLYKILAKEANDLFILNNIALKLVDWSFPQPVIDIFHAHFKEIVDTNKAKKAYYMNLEPSCMAEKLAIDTELMLLKLDNVHAVSTLLIALPELEKSLPEVEENYTRPLAE